MKILATAPLRGPGVDVLRSLGEVVEEPWITGPGQPMRLLGDTDLAARLETLLADEAVGRIVLDLKDVTLVDRAAVRSLAAVEATGTQIVNCPEYVRIWITAESEHQ